MPKDRKQTYSDRQAQAARDQKQQSAKTATTKPSAQSDPSATKKRPRTK